MPRATSKPSGKAAQPGKTDITRILKRQRYGAETLDVIRKENLLPASLLTRLDRAYPVHSAITGAGEFMFTDKDAYVGLTGLREIAAVLARNGIELGDMEERELFIHVYRFMATKHVLNMINWKDFRKDPLFQLVFPQPGMVRPDIAKKYLNASGAEEKKRIVADYMRQTNPHDGKQKLNKPWFIGDGEEMQVLDGSQHKYPQCQLIFDAATQNCFAFCTYCFRHAQVRGDEDMFSQQDIAQVHDYLRKHTEISDILITGGDAGYITFERFQKYALPLMEDESLSHIKTVRLGSRALTFQPGLVLTRKFDRMLALFRKLTDSGIQVVWMSHFSTPREVLNPTTIAAIRRLKAHGVTVKSQSPIMRHISLFDKADGSVDVDRSAKNWIDLGNVLAMLGVGFHSMYCARPTGEHHYFTAPLADINKVFSRVYRSLASINRPSRYITMTSSAGKISMLGTAEIDGETLFALKFNEGRNMEWLDKVYLAKYDEKENTIAKLKPYRSDKHFYEDELAEIETRLEKAFESAGRKAGADTGSDDK